MNLEITEKSINEAFSNIDKINQSDKKIKNLVDETIELLDQGKKCPCGSGKKYKHCCGSI